MMRTFFLGLLIILLPINHMEMMPQQLMGISGNNPVNIIWLISFVLVLAQGTKSRISVPNYFSLPLILFIAAYSVAAIWSAIDVNSIRPSAGHEKITVSVILLSYLFKPLQILVTGWFVYRYCKNNDSEKIAISIKLIPVFLLPFMAYYYYAGATGAAGYFSSREFLSVKMGLNANELGGLAAMVLGYNVGSIKTKFKKLDYISISAALLVIVFSLSRMAFIATTIIFLLGFKKFPIKQKLIFILLSGLIVTAFIPLLLSRMEYGTSGVDKGKVDANELSAGRIDYIWIPSLQMIEEHPILGQGVLSIWKGTYKIKSHKSIAMPSHPHNAYLQVALDMGLVGIVLLINLLIAMWRVARTDVGFKYVFLVWGLMGLTGSTFYPDIYILPVWIVYGLTCALPYKTVN